MTKRSPCRSPLLPIAARDCARALRAIGRQLKGRAILRYLFTVAQIFNLPYRRFVIGRTSATPKVLDFADNPQVTNLRYSRLQVCATSVGHTEARYVPRTSALLGALALAGVLAGCGDKPAGSQETETEAAQAPQFSANKGLQLPEETRRSLDLKITEVTEQKVSASLDLQLRIYQVGGGTALASGMITPEEAKLLQVGEAVQIRTSETNAIPAGIFKISDQLAKAAGLVEVLVDISNPPDSLAVGGFLRASVTLDSGEKVLTIPRAALLQCSEGPFVYAVSGDCLVRAAVKVGASNDEFVEIKDGLYSGDQVALQPVLSLWLAELAAIKGGQACCIEPPRGR